MIDNVILNSLANRNLAPCQQIKNCAENKRLTISTSNSQLQEQNSGNSGIGEPKTLTKNQSGSNQFKIQSALSQKNVSAITKSKILANNINAMQKRTKRQTSAIFKGGFIPDEVKTLKPRGRKDKKHPTVGIFG